MREQNNSTAITPTVLVVSNAEIQAKQQSQSLNIEYAVADIKDFHLVIQKPCDFYCIMLKEFDFGSAKSIEKMIQALNKGLYSIVYSDLLIVNSQHNIEIYRPQLSFRANLRLNCPFVFKNSGHNLKPKFNIDNEQLVLSNAIQSLSSKLLLYHIPEPLFTIKYAGSPSPSQ